MGRLFLNSIPKTRRESWIFVFYSTFWYKCISLILFSKISLNKRNFFEFSFIKNCQLWICVIILFYIKDLYRVIICNKTKKKKHWKKSMDSPLITFFQKSYFWENIFTLGWYFKSIGTIIALKFIKIVFWEFPHELKLLQ